MVLLLIVELLDILIRLVHELLIYRTWNCEFMILVALLENLLLLVVHDVGVVQLLWHHLLRHLLLIVKLLDILIRLVLHELLIYRS
jgi:hypothetical protein